MKKALLFCALLLFVAANGISQDLLDGDDDDDVLMDDLLDKIYDDESSKWWNKEWKYPLPFLSSAAYVEAWPTPPYTLVQTQS